MKKVDTADFCSVKADNTKFYIKKGDTTKLCNEHYKIVEWTLCNGIMNTTNLF